FEIPPSNELVSEMPGLSVSSFIPGTAESSSDFERPSSNELVSEKPGLSVSSFISGAAESSSGFQGQVIRYLKTLDRKIEDIATNQAKLNLYLLPNEKVVNSPPGMPTCPLLTIDSLKTIENYLKDEENLATMCVYLSSHVSKNPDKEKESTKKVLASLLGNSLAKEFSFKGRRGKMNFSAHPLWKVVKGALCSKLENSDLSEAEATTKSWLKDAPNRTQEDGTETGRKQTAKPSRRSGILSDSE
ncbi:UDP-glycosyltransferase 90A2, partial [Frankliniella fusca]